MVSYSNSIIGSTAIVTSLAQAFYDKFDIQSPAQLVIYSLAGISAGVFIAGICNRQKIQELERSVENDI